MLVTLNQILEPTRKNRFAVGAFNVTESTMFKAVVTQAEADHAPAIIQVSPNEFAFSEKEQYLYFTARLQRSRLPFVLHFDHARSYESCVQAVQAGFTSVMIDGSRLPYEENAELTGKVVEMAHAAGVSVEGEIGCIGETGDFRQGLIRDMIYSTPQDVARFCRDTGVDALAVSIGTVHGLIPKSFHPCLQQERLKEIATATAVPLVLHGASGIPKEQIAQACQNGISKVNVSSEFKYAYYQSVVRFVGANPTVVSPTLVAKDATEAVRAVVHQFIETIGAAQKGILYGAPCIPDGGEY